MSWLGLEIKEPSWILTIQSLRTERIIVVLQCYDQNKIIELMTRYAKANNTLYPCTIHFQHEHVIRRVNEDIITDFTDVNEAYKLIIEKINQDIDICSNTKRTEYLTTFESQMKIYKINYNE